METGSTNQKLYLGHRKRIKQKFLLSGLSSWHDYEILEFILTYSVACKDTKTIAKNLLSKFKTFGAILSAEINELKQIKGITDHTAILLKLIKELLPVYLKEGILNKDLISSPESAVNYLKTIFKGECDEKFYTLFLDASNHLISIENTHAGTINKSAVYPRKIVERALYNHAAGIIIAHNHPSGSYKPSDDDKKTTIAVKNALETVEIVLLDHILIAKDNYFS